MRRRSFVLISVLAVMGSALLLAMSLLMLGRAHAAAMSGAAARAQSRSLAWSGLQVVMAELDGQRERILEGNLPQVQGQYTIYEAAGREGIVRLLAAGPGAARLAAESGRLDLGTVDAAALVATGLADEAQAAAIIAWRDGRGDREQLAMGSIGELLAVEGVTPETLYGPLEELAPPRELAGAEDSIAERVLERLDVAAPRGLDDVLTVHAWEPAVQRTGDRRISLNVPWSDELGERLDRRFGEGAGGIVKGIIDSGTRFSEESVIYRILLTAPSPPEDWPAIIDSITAETGPLHFGRVNINAAPAEVLAALPEIGAERAAQVVRAREALSAEDRSTIAWPILAGIIPAEAYATLGARLTCRSWTFRLRLAAGEVDADDPEGPIHDPVIHEVVIDLAGPKPRVAYLRDVTFLHAAAVLAGQVPPPDDELLEEELPEEEPLEDDGPGGEPGSDEEPGPATAPGAAPDTDSSGEDDWSMVPWLADEEPVEPGTEADGAGGTESAPGEDASAAPSPHRRLGRWAVRGGG